MATYLEQVTSDARSSINRVFNVREVGPEEIIEAMEILLEDIEMYVSRLEEKVDEETRE